MSHLKDIIKQDIQVGDWVLHTGGHYASGRLERVVKLTPKMVTTCAPRYYGNQVTRYGFVQGTSKNPSSLVVVTEQLGKSRDEIGEGGVKQKGLLG
jgi:hypothetical protein